MEDSKAQKLVTATQHDISEIKSEVTLLSIKLTKVHDALIGNEMSKDGGLVQRIIDSEQEVEKLKTRISTLESISNRQAFYVKVIWGLGGTTTATIFAYILKLVFK